MSDLKSQKCQMLHLRFHICHLLSEILHIACQISDVTFQILQLKSHILPLTSQNQTLYETNCRAVFKMSGCGSKVIDCSWTRLDGVHLVLPFKASSAHTRRWLLCQCGPGQTSFYCPQSWCFYGRWDVNEIPHVSFCCIVFQCNAPGLFYTKIATLRCTGDARYQSCSL